MALHTGGALVAMFLPVGVAVSQDLQAELAWLVDLLPAGRRSAADHLAKRKEIALEDWLAAMRDFGGFEPIAAGAHRHVVELVVGEEIEKTELHLYVPKGYDPSTPAPLVLFGHGTGGNGADGHVQWTAVADRLGMVVLSPSEKKEQAGWAFTERERQSALAALRWARRTVNVDENRIFVSGISRGGHMTWDLVLRHPDLFAAAAPFIGGPRLNIAAGQNNLRYLENAVHLPIRDLQGSRDDPLLLANLRQAFARLEQLGAGDAKLIEFPEYGHRYDFTAVDWAEFLGAAKRDPEPEQVVRLAAKASEARAFWVEILGFERDVAETFRPRVDGRKWDALDEAGKRRYLGELALERTARLMVRRTAPGQYTAEGHGVRRFRLLLTAAMLDEDGRLAVKFEGRVRRKRPRQDKKVLLREFAERFDRTFLPIAHYAVQ